MTREQLVAMEQRLTFQIQATREQVLRLEGYRMCVADIIKADDDAAKPAPDAAAKTPARPPKSPKKPTEKTDAQATA